MNSENENGNGNGVPAENGSDRIETQQIVNITPSFDDKGRALAYSVLTEEATHVITYLGNQPENIIVVNDLPLVTCSRHYEPISHQKLLEMFSKALALNDMAEDGTTFDFLPSTFYRMAKTIFLGEYEYSGAGKLKFGILITNSYDLSLGIHVDAFLYNKEDNTTVFLGMAGSWKTFMKHYHDHEGLQVKLNDKLKFIVENVGERTKLSEKFATHYMTPLEMTKFARNLWIKKAEVEALKSVLPEFVNCSWVKNEGFTCVDVPQPLSAWDVIKAFSLFAAKLSEDRRLDVAMRLYSLMDMTLKDKVPTEE